MEEPSGNLTPVSGPKDVLASVLPSPSSATTLDTTPSAQPSPTAAVQNTQPSIITTLLSIQAPMLAVIAGTTSVASECVLISDIKALHTR